jgi:hypothetical protein
VIACVFTLDYEIYGNGEGALRPLVYEPTERLRELFAAHGVRFVPFVEAAELEVIEAHGTDAAVELVKAQLRQLYLEGFLPGLHLHPQWYNGRHRDGRWTLDASEYNLCVLPKQRIAQIVDRALAYLRRVLEAPDFTPVSFRAGNWLFQPASVAAEVLAERGIKLDSSVFKGGVRHEHRLDYRPALRNGYYWRFTQHAEVADRAGRLVEVPIYSRMVPFWKLGSSKRLGLERQHVGRATGRRTLYRLRDLSRLFHPLKFDFCRMTFKELTTMIAAVIADDRRTPTTFKPLVAIGHSKELVDFETISSLLSWLADNRIGVSTFEDVYARCA